VIVLILTFFVNLLYAQKTTAPKEQPVPCNGNADELELAEDRGFSKRIFENFTQHFDFEVLHKMLD